jgi:hypothetical protein
MTEDAWKVCSECGQQLPNNHDNFKRKKDGLLDTRCLICRRAINAGKRKRKKAQYLKDVEVGAVNNFLRAAQTGGQSIPHSAELLERLMEYFGGTSGFSALLVKQYFDSPPGGAARTKMLETVVRLVTKNTDQGGAKKPLTQWTEDELEAELDGRLRALASEFQGRIIDGTLSQEAPGAAAIADRQEDERVRARPDQGDPGGAGGPEDRGPAAVPADS